MNQQIKEYQSFTVEQFQNNFDTLMNRVESGETFMIESEYGTALIVPYKEIVNIFEDSQKSIDDIIRIHTDHEEGS